MSKRLLTLILSLLIVLVNFNYVFAEGEYKVADASSGSIVEIESFDNYSKALTYYDDNKDLYENLIILNEDKVIKMEYGVVTFFDDENSSTTTYISSNNDDAYINASYAGDACYLDTTDDEKYIYFKLSGDVGKILLEDTTLTPYEMVDVRLSKYSVSSNSLHHDIKTNLNNDYYSFSIVLDEKPLYLENNSSYYSYDGHYFYDDFKTMADDYRKDSYSNSLNSDNPYYNYYLYLPHRSYTNYSLDEIEDYFTNKLYLDGKICFYDDLNLDNANDNVNLSQLYGEWQAFLGYEKLYGANAMMMISLACHESAYGKSLLAFSKNNLFGHAAYDSDVERFASRYNNIETSIYSHAKYYISRSYAGVHGEYYHGSNFGNKLGGMNVMYSSDPYWGEKAASNYYRFDDALGLKDKDAYAIGIIDNLRNLNVYNNPSLSNISFKLENVVDYPLIILEELDNAYKVQVDVSYSDDYLYDPNTSVGYVEKDLIDYVINEDKIHEDNYNTYEFDLDGGEIIDENVLTIKTKEGTLPCLTNPYKEGYEFIGYDNEYSEDNKNYKALYKKIDSIEIYYDFNKVIEYNYFYNLKGGKIKVYYENHSNSVIDINTNMIESYDPNIEGDSNLIINYCGVKIEYPVTFSTKLNEYREKLNEYISKNISSYKENKTYDLDELAYIKENLRKVDYLTSFEDIRYIDAMLLENSRDKVNYHFKESPYDVSISGLALSLKDPKTINVFKPFKDTYFVETYGLSKVSYDRLSEVALAYGFDIEDSLRVAVSYNLARANFDNPIIIQVKVQDKKQDKIYTVYHLDDDGNVIKCMTTQTNNYVSFMTRSEGDFMILSLDSVNTYNINDAYENMSALNADPDNHQIVIEALIIISMALLGFIMIILNYIINSKREKLWNDYKKLLQVAEYHREEKLKN